MSYCVLEFLLQPKQLHFILGFQPYIRHVKAIWSGVPTFQFHLFDVPIHLIDFALHIADVNSDFSNRATSSTTALLLKGSTWAAHGLRCSSWNITSWAKTRASTIWALWHTTIETEGIALSITMTAFVRSMTFGTFTNPVTVERQMLMYYVNILSFLENLERTWQKINEGRSRSATGQLEMCFW